jgi:predicted dehydrogenase
MKQVLIKSGAAELLDIPAPSVDPKSILVSVDHSCISVGTEMSNVRLSAMPLYKRALKQPENVLKVVQSIKDNGLKSTLSKVRGKLDFGSPTGYSASGHVVAIGDQVSGFSIGDFVACAGAGIANHAEIINVPVNLAVKVPQTLSLLEASTVTLGAIAMQGIRRLNPSLGEAIAVVGMGILGLIAAQILKANGCQVIAIDPNAKRLQFSKDCGADLTIHPFDEHYEGIVKNFTNGYGVDGVVITAASPSDEIIHQAALATRKKGRIVLVGDVGLGLKRADFYQKEIDFLISCSYGPGRYDPYYELEGQDYPLPYVRWTENRNMEAYLALLSQKKIVIPDQHIFDVHDVKEAYASLQQGDSSPLSVFLRYNRTQEERLVSKINLQNDVSKGNIKFAIIGGSSFVQSIHLPNIQQLGNCSIHAVMSRTGTTASAIAQQFKATYATTNYDDVLKDKDVDAVLISSRHNLHGSQVLSGLRSNKAVFVEKPLATNHEELSEIEEFYNKTSKPPLLMTGFNRRFAPIMQVLKSKLQGRKTPLIVNYRMNAGFIPKDHWVQTYEGAGRNIGEACHIYDLFNFLTGSIQTQVSANSIRPQSSHWLKNDNFVATISYADGSVATLTYTSLGSKECPKERMDVYVDGSVFVMDDFKHLESYSNKKRELFSSNSVDKGHKNEMKAFLQALQTGVWPISLQDQIQATQISLLVEDQIQRN